MTEWQPMATAPHGKPVLVVCDWVRDKNNKPVVRIGRLGTRREITKWTVWFSAESCVTHGTPSAWMDIPEPPSEYSFKEEDIVIPSESPVGSE